MHNAPGETTASNPSVTKGAELNGSRLILDAAVDHVANRPQAEAVRAETGSLSWRELGSAAQQVADRLRSVGVERGDHVVVSVPSDHVLPIAMLGTLSAGAVYVPVDSQHPVERVQALVRQLGATAVVADRAIDALGATVVVATIEQLASAPWQRDVAFEPEPVAATDSAYVIFTSGSTGTPNGR